MVRTGQWRCHLRCSGQVSGDVTWDGQDRSVGMCHLWSGQASGDVTWDSQDRSVGMSHLGWSGQVSRDVPPVVVRTGQ